MKNIKAIPTAYNGHSFRSRLEARWAIFFDVANIKWIYELEGFRLDNGVKYLPDFYLPEVWYRNIKMGVWIEIKPTENHVDKDLLTSFAIETKEPIFALVGKVHTGEGDFYHQQFAPCDDENYDFWWDEPMLICKCSKCGHVKIEFSEGNYLYCQYCPTYPCTPDEFSLKVAERTANSYDFRLF